MKKTLFISLSIIVVIAAAFLALLAFSIKGSKDCSSFVIDSTEIIAGMDIPNVDEADCYHDKTSGIRVGVYLLDQKSINIDEYINTYEFKSVDENKSMLLWAKKTLIDASAPLPHKDGQIVYRSGSGERTKWQCFLDKSSGRLWVEIDWKE